MRLRCYAAEALQSEWYMSIGEHGILSRAGEPFPQIFPGGDEGFISKLCLRVLKISEKYLTNQGLKRRFLGNPCYFKIACCFLIFDRFCA